MIKAMQHSRYEWEVGRGAGDPVVDAPTHTEICKETEK